MRSLFSSAIFCASILTAHSATALEARVLTLDGHFEGEPSRTPLGSIWKLFAYAYQSETGRHESDYVCRGDDPDEIFCCKPGDQIGRDQALAKSCAPYFSPARLDIDPRAWRIFWSARSTAPWLRELSLLKPETRVAAEELLKSLQTLREFKSFDQIEKAAVGTVINGTAQGALKTWGSTLRVKTFTWRDETLAGETAVDALGFNGGFAGWLPDGSAIWVSQAGHGRDAFGNDLRAIVDRHLQVQDAGCVRVHYFDRYKIMKPPPSLHGPVELKFANGSRLNFIGDGSLHFDGGRDQKISAELSENEYVARVLDREVAAAPIDAARAFALLARTFLYQNASRTGACLEIADSSHLQRVSPTAASPAALRIARWSEGLFIQGVSNLRYHSNINSTNRLSWTNAVSLARSGFSMPEILKSAYPTSAIVFGYQDSARECEPNLATASWIKEQSRAWRRVLNSEEGFEIPTALRVCKVQSRISSDLKHEEIFVPSIRSRDDEISVLHEYLHVGFRNHPHGRDETFIERQARALLGEK